VSPTEEIDIRTVSIIIAQTVSWDFTRPCQAPVWSKDSSSSRPISIE
jgi:hypothetical protein